PGNHHLLGEDLPVYDRLFRTYVPNLSEPNVSNEMYGSCPFHDDHDPSFSANVNTGLWYCHRCEIGGDAYEFLARLLEDVEPDEIRRHLAELTGRPPLPSKEDIEAWQQNLMESHSTREYLRKRGVDNPELLQKYRIGFDGERITIPIYDEKGALVNVRRLRVGESKTNGPKAINWPGHGETRLWPMTQLLEAPDNLPLLLRAGEIDCLSAISQGYYAVT